LLNQLVDSLKNMHYLLHKYSPSGHL